MSIFDVVDLLQAEGFECFVDMLEVNVERAKSIDLVRRKFCHDFRLGFYVLRESPLTFPRFHRRPLHGFISDFAFQTGAGKRK